MYIFATKTIVLRPILRPFLSLTPENANTARPLFQLGTHTFHLLLMYEIGRASCRERV